MQDFVPLYGKSDRGDVQGSRKRDALFTFRLQNEQKYIFITVSADCLIQRFLIPTFSVFDGLLSGS
jgi:hypothetical protein